MYPITSQITRGVTFPISDYGGTGPTPSGYQIAGSLRLRSSASAYLSRTLGASGSKTTWAQSLCVKRGSLGANRALFSTSYTLLAETYVRFNASDQLEFTSYTAGGANYYSIVSNQVFRDPSAWYLIDVVLDTTNATASNRMRLYVNGVQITSFASSAYPPQNYAGQWNDSAYTHYIGAYEGTSAFFDGYLADINFIDGQALDPTYFGAFSSTNGVWGPKAYSGTYGTNGFYLKFNNGTSTTTLGYDSSGNSNNWTTNNISLTAGSTYDWMIDSPTSYAGSSYGVGNYCTLNPLVPGASTLSNGNLTSAGSTVYPTIQPTSGNWYFEINGVAQNWTPPAAFPTGTGDFNFGQRPFANTPTSGYKSLCTQNLSTPTIQQGNKFMDAVIWTGADTGTGRSISGLNFSPDFWWNKPRSQAYSHMFYDTVRGAGSTKELSSNSTAAEGGTNAATYGYLSSFDSTGVTWTRGSAGSGTNPDGYADYDELNATYVAWAWKASNAAAVSNTAGSITSQVSANTTAGFSVVTFTAQSSGTGTVGHGLGVAPSMIILKQRAQVGSWGTYHVSTGNTQRLLLNTTDAAATTSSYWNNTSPSSSIFTIGTGYATAGDMVAYCFAAIPGYSAFGSYTGNGSADGPFVYLGFRPKYVLVKATNSAENWFTWDTSRDPYNVASNDLYPNLSNAESGGTPRLDFLSNGFKCRASAANPNLNGATYIYAAFAENPFQNALAR